MGVITRGGWYVWRVFAWLAATTPLVRQLGSTLMIRIELNHCHWRELEGLKQDTAWGSPQVIRYIKRAYIGYVHLVPLLQVSGL